MKRATSMDQPIDVICVEYQEGMENWDIPYFDGYAVG